MSLLALGADPGLLRLIGGDGIARDDGLDDLADDELEVILREEYAKLKVAQRLAKAGGAVSALGIFKWLKFW